MFKYYTIESQMREKGGGRERVEREKKEGKDRKKIRREKKFEALPIYDPKQFRDHFCFS